MTDCDIKSFLDQINVKYLTSVSLSKKTWIKRGGRAHFWITPNTIEHLQAVKKYLFQNGVDFDLVGFTSNIYFTNDYNPLVVISTTELKLFSVLNSEIVCEPGVSTSHLARYCVEHGYAGYEGQVNLPGTIASAVYNNSGCFNCSIASLFINITFLFKECNISILTKEYHQYKKRSSLLKRKELQGVILKVVLSNRQRQSSKMLRRIAKDVTEEYRLTQEDPQNNFGSVFGTIKGYRKDFRYYIFVLILGIYILLRKFSSIDLIKAKQSILPFLVTGNHKVLQDAGPEYFITYVAKAVFVITSLFHGMALSIILRKSFYSVGLVNKAERFASLLSIIGLENRILYKTTNRITTFLIPKVRLIN